MILQKVKKYLETESGLSKKEKDLKAVKWIDRQLMILTRGETTTDELFDSEFEQTLELIRFKLSIPTIDWDE